MTPAKLRAFANLFHNHARTCKGLNKKGEPCKSCASGIKFFQEVPIHLLSGLLAETAPPRSFGPSTRPSK